LDQGLFDFLHGARLLLTAGLKPIPQALTTDSVACVIARMCSSSLSSQA